MTAVKTNYTEAGNRPPLINNQYTILIVDDEERLRKALKRSLCNDSCRTLTAASGVEALKYIKRKGIDIVITDLMMPKMDGMELIKTIRQEHAEMKIIIISAYGTTENIQEAEELGVDYFLAKPFDLTHLKSIVKGLVQAMGLLGQPDEGYVRYNAKPAVRRLWFKGGKTTGAITSVPGKVLHCFKPGSVLFALGKVTGVVSKLAGSVFHREVKGK